MKYNPDKHHRRSIRLRGYDYAQAGMYFVTVCVRDRECLFGDVVDGEMRLNEMGQIVDKEWQKTITLRKEIDVDIWVVMPNHVHGVVVIRDVVHTNSPVGAYGHTPLQSPSKTIGAMIRGFKSAATKQINEWRQMPGLPVWQRNYYERIIRNDDSLGRIRQYIADNPLRWAFDPENPAATQQDSLEEWV